MTEWKSTTWGDIISLEYGKSLKGYKNGLGNYQVFGSNGSIGWSQKPLTNGPGVILGRKGAYRGIEFSQEDFWVIDTAYFTKPLIELSTRWLYYAMKGYQVGDINDGSPIPSTPRAFVYKENVNLPPLSEQKAIAHVLGKLDDKIALNRKMNQSLEAMAQALFKSWFVDFDPVLDNALAAAAPIPQPLQAKAQRRAQVPQAQKLLQQNPELAREFPSTFCFNETLKQWIPEGWEVKALRQITSELRRGISPKYTTEESGTLVLNQKCIRNHEINYGLGRRNDTTKKKVDGRLLRPGDMLVNSTGTGTLGRVANVVSLSESTVVDSHVTIIRADTTVVDMNYFNGLIFSMERKIESMGEGSTGQTELSRARLSELNVLLPPLYIQASVSEHLYQFFLKKDATIKQSNQLTQLRDTLLPRLISGKLRLPKELVAQFEAMPHSRA